MIRTPFLGPTASKKAIQSLASNGDIELKFVLELRDSGLSG